MKIRFDAVDVRYGDTPALTGVDLDVATGEWLGLIGPSGSGKTSALRAAAGFERIAGGRISLDDRCVAGGRVHLPPEKRGPGFVFQAFALFPHLSVAENIAFGLRHQPRDARAERVRAMLALVELTGYADRSPSTLSGGQQQRVALARALAPEPPALLMDEPFGSLDPDLRGIVRARVVETLRARGCTVIFISHDIDEAFALADRLAILRGGVLQQVATPEEAYDRPASAFVAGFLGPVNLIPGLAEGDRMRTPLGDVRLARAAHGPRLAVARPHLFKTGGAGALAVVLDRVFRGPLVEVSLRLADADLPALRVHLPADHTAHPGDRLHLSIDAPLSTVEAHSGA